MHDLYENSLFLHNTLRDQWCTFNVQNSIAPGFGFNFNETFLYINAIKVTLDVVMYKEIHDKLTLKVLNF